MIKLASCDYIDLKPYEADMRYILDTYISCREYKVVSELGNMSIVELSLQGKTTTPADLVKASQEIMRQRQRPLTITCSVNTSRR